MTEKDKEIHKAAASTAIAAVVSLIDTKLAAAGLPPVLTPVVGLTAALVLADQKTAEEDILKWVKFMKENPDAFAQNICSQPIFQKQTVKWLQEYLASTVEYRKEIMRQIYLGMAQANPEEFPFDRLMNAVKQVSMKDIEVLRKVPKRLDHGFRVPGMSEYQQIAGSDSEVESVYHLISLGIVTQDAASRYGGEVPSLLLVTGPHIKLSDFGDLFLGYLGISSATDTFAQ